jgi:antitoxin component YwqK of YwqJK toxin-antitoxin module
MKKVVFMCLAFMLMQRGITQQSPYTFTLIDVNCTEFCELGINRDNKTTYFILNNSIEGGELKTTPSDVIINGDYGLDLNPKYIGKNCKIAVLTKKITSAENGGESTVEAICISEIVMIEDSISYTTIKDTSRELGTEIINYWNDDPNDKVKEKGRVNNDKKIGEWSTYYSSGQLETICNYTDDKLNGEYKSYFENGKLKQKANYINDKSISNESYYENGQLKQKTSPSVEHPNRKGIYVPNGEWIEYYENGQVKKQCTYLEGEKIGTALEYFSNGNLQWKKNFNKSGNGLEEGEQFLGWENGQTRTKWTSKNGKRFGAYIDYHDSGKINEKGNYGTDGKKTGEWNDYDTKGILKSKTYFNTEGKMTKRITYNSDGSVKETKTY